MGAPSQHLFEPIRRFAGNPRWFVVLTLGLSSRSAWSGVTPPSVDLRRLSLSTDPEAALVLEPPATPGHLAWNAGLWASYAYRSVALDDQAGEEIAVPLEHQLSFDYFASLGLTDRLAFGALLPMVLHQSGEDAQRWLPDAVALPERALGDLALTGKATLLARSAPEGLALAALARVTLPTGAPASYLSEGQVTSTLRLLGEVSLDSVALRVSGGLHYRRVERSFAGLRFGSELPFALGVRITPEAFGVSGAGNLQWNLEVHGALAVQPSFADRLTSSGAVAISIHYVLGDFALTLGSELPLLDAIGTPSFRGLLGVGYVARSRSPGARERSAR